MLYNTVVLITNCRGHKQRRENYKKVLTVSVRENMTDVMVNFMCHLGWVMVPSYESEIILDVSVRGIFG